MLRPRVAASRLLFSAEDFGPDSAPFLFGGDWLTTEPFLSLFREVFTDLTPSTS